MDLSIVIPTYNEKDNIIGLVSKIQHEFRKNKIKGELIIVDDNSPDGTGKIIDKLSKKYKNLRVIHRGGKLGLSSAALDGWKIARGKVIGLMDADLSHPPEKIKDLYFSIKKDGYDFSIGSRYIKGGKIEGWDTIRKVMSKTATLLARIYTKVKDPMTGFFMIKREVIKDADLDSKGFKILLEVIIKGKYNKIKEIPITFINRVKGKSKASMKEVIYYIQNLAGYLKYKRKVVDEFFKFAGVGATGILVNIFFLYLLTEKAGMHYLISAVFSFILTMTSNFVLNKIWTFEEDVKQDFLDKYLQFCLVSAVSLAVNLTFLFIFTEQLGLHYLVSQTLAIGVAFLVNFLGNKIWTFARY